MTSYQTITSDITDGKAVIRLNRPDKYNALNSQMRAELADAVRRAATSARVIVLTGNGPAFCSGQDLSDGTDLADPDLERVLRDEYQPLIRAIDEARVPVIAAVNGPAAGAGANIALGCDVVIATESAYFLQAFSRIGLIPDAGGTYWMPRAMGGPKAMGAALFADKISAKQADDWGMIWEAVPDAEFEATWNARADMLAKGPTQAYAMIKQSIRANWGNDLDAQLDLEGKLQGKAGKTRDFKEGVLAFIEKRKAQFEGR